MVDDSQQQEGTVPTGPVFNAEDKEEEEERIRVRSAMEKFALGMDDEMRERELKAVLDSDINFEEKEQEVESNDMLEDFYIVPDTLPHESIETPEPVIPLMFYDNDDGFWNEYI